MTRSIWKGPFCLILPLTETKQKKYGNRRKIWSRHSVILPRFLGQDFHVHNGKSFTPLKVYEEMIGHKFGEFAITRKKPIHKKKIKKMTK